MSSLCVVALDVGGTEIKAALLDTRARTLVTRREPTRREAGPDAVVDLILATVDELLTAAAASGHTVTAVGVVVPGVVDEETGTAVFSANLGWREVPLRRLLEGRTGLPVAFGHDVRAGGHAEHRLGAGRGVHDFLFVAIGTGIASAIMLKGRPYPGGGPIGEIGHLIVDPLGRRCRCGARGCLETVASATAVARRYRELASPATPLSTAEVAHRAAAGDPMATAVWGQAVEALVTALASCVTLLSPDVVIMGGGLAEAGDQLLRPLTETLSAALHFQRVPRLERAQLGDQAGCLGAGLLAWELTGASVDDGGGLRGVPS
jgi:glucokinase